MTGGFNAVGLVATVAADAKDKFKKLTVPVFVDMFAATKETFLLGDRTFIGRVVRFNLTSTNQSSPERFDVLRSISFSLMADPTSEQPSIRPIFFYVPNTQQMIFVTPTNRGYGTDFTPDPINTLFSPAYATGNVNVVPSTATTVELWQYIDDDSNVGPWGSVNFNNFEQLSFGMQG